MMTLTRCLWFVAALTCLSVQADEQVKINHLQFVGSHNSYKLAMSEEYAKDLAVRNPQAALSLEYSHLPLHEQLDLGLRKLELDVFYQPQTENFAVGHVQVIDMNSHCATLRDCLTQVTQWSEQNPQHVPIWISFNAKDQKIEGLPDPTPFDRSAFVAMDQVLVETLGPRLIWPRTIRPQGSMQPVWPTLSDARGKVLVILDEGGTKRTSYLEGWRSRPMFVGVAPPHPAAAIQIINDPIEDNELIKARVEKGYMVRTRADADTVEARSNDTTRRDAAFASGAQAISTDYYLPASHFGNDYVVELTPAVRCNPVTAPVGCTVTE